MQTAYLIDNEPRRAQWATYRDPVTAVVMHTAESTLFRSNGELRHDAAEGVASYIRWRTTPGAYHLLADPHKFLYLVPFDYAAYGEDTGGNRWAIHLSAAGTTEDWRAGGRLVKLDGSLTPIGAAFIRQLGDAARFAVSWVAAKYGHLIPARKIDVRGYRSGALGFIAHSEVDPADKTDPGPFFPWDAFFKAVESSTFDETPTTKVTTTMTRSYVRQAQQALNSVDAGLVEDGLFGPKTLAAIKACVQDAQRWAQVEALCFQG